ncbi:MAG: 23S rRNA (uracil(1939)-C(5))-methyltransferase RlmD [Lachnospiraceae bacterium]|nr:23S rRNA (uracil(1939)-C(5))-methyltransferase RlmD [Lachnospiraceae bacterium]
MEKNEVYEIRIEDIGNDGEGIGHADGVAVFVKDAVMGDTVKVKIIKVKKNYVYGRLLEIVEPSIFRVEPVCEKARACGGCTLQHMSYEKQLAYKWNKVKNCLERIGGISNADGLMEPILGMEHPFSYRNKMQFPVGIGKDGHTELGFYAGRTHSLIGLSECAIGHPVNKEIIRVMKEFVEQFHISAYDEKEHRGLLRHVLTRVGFQTGELMVCLVINGDSIPHGDVLYDMLEKAVRDFNGSSGKGIEEDELPSGMEPKADLKLELKSLMININKDKTNKILGSKSKPLYGDAYITDYIGDVAFHISPQSFYQVNPLQTKVLYDKALEYADLTGNETVWDMYCGIGTISLFLAKRAKQVYAVEIVPQAIEDARENAKRNGIRNVEFFCGKAEEVVSEIYNAGKDGAKADVVVVDPPRKGCDEALLKTIIAMAPKCMVYVSCDPATLARDLKYLTAHGFEVQRVAVVDQFAHSTHVESVCLLHRRDL